MRDLLELDGTNFGTTYVLGILNDLLSLIYDYTKGSNSIIILQSRVRPRMPWDCVSQTVPPIAKA
jgi:hypothetical protein